MTALATTTRTCAHCGAPYTPYRQVQRFCSPRCRDRHHKAIGSQSRREQAPERQCAVCGATYRSNIGRQQTCGSPRCYKTLYRARTAAAKPAKAAQPATPPPAVTVPCKSCGAAFVRSQRRRAYCSDECRAAGMTGANHEIRPAVLAPSADYAPHRPGHFTDAQFLAELDRIRAELRAAGQPVVRMTAELVREVSRRELGGGVRGGASR